MKDVLLLSRNLGLLALAALAAGCFPAQDEAADLGGNPPPGQVAECVENSDCIPAGSSCCECPTFALPVSSGWDESCEDVSCDRPTGCASAEAVCDEGSCVLQCQAVRCDVVCENGFETDDLGCLVCPASWEECGIGLPSAPACEFDSDCVQVPADCCGCARGGTDTAVPVAEADSYLGAFTCDEEPACPNVDVCNPELVPRCIAGTCQLDLPPPDDGDLDGGTGNEGPGGQYCGTPEYPPCPAGQVCVLNDPDANDASASGVGVCRPE